MTSERISVLVTGGGIAGLASALSLARAGHEVTVFEQAAAFAEVGAGLQLAPNATRVLEQLGLYDQVARQAVFPDRLLMLDAVDEEPIAALDLGGAFRDHYAAPYLVMHRHDLLSELLRACEDSNRIELQTGRQVTLVEPKTHAVRVCCDDGSDYECDAVIGADGVRSITRRIVSDDDLHATGYVAYRGPVPTERLAGKARLDAVRVFIGPGLHLVQYPLRGGELYNQVAVFHSDRYTPDHEDWGTPEELNERFASMAPTVRESVGLLDRSMRWPMHDRLPIDNWTRGRVTLVGDAAHPMLQYLAQGACQALEDAVQLGLSFAPGRNTEEAFLEYQSLRIPRTARVQRTARAWGELWHLDGVARQVRNRLLRMHTADDYRDSDWLYGFDCGGAHTHPSV